MAKDLGDLECEITEKTTKIGIGLANAFSAIGPVGQRCSVKKEFEAIREGEIGAAAKEACKARAKAGADLTLATAFLPLNILHKAIVTPVHGTLAVGSVPFLPFSKKARKFGKNQAKATVVGPAMLALQVPRIVSDGVSVVCPEMTAVARADMIQRAMYKLAEAETKVDIFNEKLEKAGSDKCVEFNSKKCKYKMR